MTFSIIILSIKNLALVLGQFLASLVFLKKTPALLTSVRLAWITSDTTFRIMTLRRMTFSITVPV